MFIQQGTGCSGHETDSSGNLGDRWENNIKLDLRVVVLDLCAIQLRLITLDKKH
jgi:hypothetical protein